MKASEKGEWVKPIEHAPPPISVDEIVREIERRILCDIGCPLDSVARHAASLQIDALVSLKEWILRRQKD